jgi:hypothetical protein
VGRREALWIETSVLREWKVKGERSPTGFETRERFGVQVRLLCLPPRNVMGAWAPPRLLPERHLTGERFDSSSFRHAAHVDQRQESPASRSGKWWFESTRAHWGSSRRSGGPLKSAREGY